MKPHGAGTVWFARDGRVAIVRSTGFARTISEKGPCLAYPLDHPNMEGDWIEVDRPRFPELKPKPRQIYARLDNEDSVSWFVETANGGWSRGAGAVSRCRLTPAYHPDNDPETMALFKPSNLQTEPSN